VARAAGSPGRVRRATTAAPASRTLRTGRRPASNIPPLTRARISTGAPWDAHFQVGSHTLWFTQGPSRRAGTTRKAQRDATPAPSATSRRRARRDGETAHRRRAESAAAKPKMRWHRAVTPTRAAAAATEPSPRSARNEAATARTNSGAAQSWVSNPEPIHTVDP
jgi:hypothetical protein